MLISRRHRFIFVHIYKNAGTSITQALRPFATTKWQCRTNMVLKKIKLSYHDPEPYAVHIPGPELMSRMGKDAFKSYFSFAIVRNPWDWQVSLYTFMLKSRRHRQHELAKSFGGFDQYIRWRCTHEVRYQKDFVFTPDGEQVVDFIGRFERLADDFHLICSRIGVSASLPKENVSRVKPYQEYYSEETKELVRRTFEPDISRFKYDFE